MWLCLFAPNAGCRCAGRTSGKVQKDGRALFAGLKKKTSSYTVFLYFYNFSDRRKMEGMRAEIKSMLQGIER